MKRAVCTPVSVFAAARGSLAAAQPTPPLRTKTSNSRRLRKFRFPKSRQSTLPNGMKVYLLENHELPLVRGLALIRTGNLFDPADKVGLADVTGSLIRSGGTTKHPATRSMMNSRTSPPVESQSAKAMAPSLSPL